MEKIWLRQYPPGTPAELSLDPATSLVDVLRRSCERFGPAPAFHNLGTTLTFEEVERRSRDFAAGLNARGLRKGERIALMMPNLLQYPIAMFGALRAGLVVVNTNPLYTPRELEHQLRDSGAVAIVVLANFAHVVEKVIARTALRHVIVTQVGDLLGFPKGAIVNWAARRIKHMVPPYRLPAAVAFRQVLDGGSRVPFAAPAIHGNDLAFLQYTGGTTGVAKGAMLSHRNLVANLEQVSTLWSGTIEDGKEIAITPLPLYHVFCMTTCLMFFKHGCLSVLALHLHLGRQHSVQRTAQSSRIRAARLLAAETRCGRRHGLASERRRALASCDRPRSDRGLWAHRILSGGRLQSARCIARRHSRRAAAFDRGVDARRRRRAGAGRRR